MVVKEHLSWILDRPCEEWVAIHTESEQKGESREAFQEREWFHHKEKYRKNIEFVHSLGLKCDCVGWSSLDLTRPDAPEILDRIEAFCKEGGWLARGGCAQWYEDFDCEWYELRPITSPYTDTHVDARCERGERRDVFAIHAYKNKGEPILHGRAYGLPIVVSERFRQACLQLGIPDVDFCWVRDTGRYASEQYFFLYPKQRVSKIACDRGLQYSDKKSQCRTPEG